MFLARFSLPRFPLLISFLTLGFFACRSLLYGDLVITVAWATDRFLFVNCGLELVGVVIRDKKLTDASQVELIGTELGSFAGERTLHKCTGD